VFPPIRTEEGFANVSVRTGSLKTRQFDINDLLSC
jgi:hypothetical protein